MSQRPPPKPPYPELVRRPMGFFGWLDAALVHDRWLANLGPHAIAVLVLLALAADRRGASFYSRDRMAAALGMSRHDLDQGLARLVADRLVAHRPWRHNCADGVWQLLPVPVLTEHPRAGRTLSAAELLRSLGFQAADTQTAE